MEEALVLVVAAVLLLSPALVASDFCVCRSDQSTAALQKAIDYSCGQGVDCTVIQQNGACYNLDDVTSHCSWAVNSYFQKYRSSGATCDFTGTATLTTTDPSSTGCSYPASASAAGTSTTGTGTGTGTGIGTGTGGTTGATPGTFTPGAGTTGTGMGTGMGVGTTTGTTGTGLGGLGPTGTSNGMDTAAACLHPSAGPAAFLAVLLSFLASA